MKKHIFIFIILLINVSCNLLKTTNRETHKTQQTTKATTLKHTDEYEVSITKRPKDSIVYYPNIITVPKDTTIIVRGKTTTLRLNYNQKGVLKKADCTAKEINEIKKTLRKITEKQTQSQSQKTTNTTKESIFKPITLLWVFVGLAFLIIVSKLTNKFI